MTFCCCKNELWTIRRFFELSHGDGDNDNNDDDNDDDDDDDDDDDGDDDVNDYCVNGK